MVCRLVLVVHHRHGWNSRRPCRDDLCVRAVRERDIGRSRFDKRYKLRVRAANVVALCNRPGGLLPPIAITSGHCSRARSSVCAWSRDCQDDLPSFPPQSFHDRREHEHVRCVRKVDPDTSTRGRGHALGVVRIETPSRSELLAVDVHPECPIPVASATVESVRRAAPERGDIS